MQPTLGRISEKLTAIGGTIATAESCTGGLVAHLLTNVAGSSGWFRGGIVAYTEQSKRNLLGLNNELADGLVTETCAKGMARQARSILGADYGMATTGVCGPAASEGFAPCTAWIAVDSANGVVAKCYQVADMGREANKQQVAVALLELLEEVLNDAQ